MQLVVCNRVRSAHTLDVFAARLLNILTKVAVHVLDLLDFHVDAKRSANIDSEAAQEWLPEGVLLYALLGQAPEDVTHPDILTSNKIILLLFFFNTW